MKIKFKFLITSIFILSYSFCMVYSFIGHIQIYHDFLQKLMLLGVVFIGISIIFQSHVYTKREILLLALMLFVSVLNFLYSKDFSLFKFTLFLYATKLVDLNKCFKYDFILRIIMFFLVIILCDNGIAPNVVSYHDGNIRYSLGFTNPNSLSMQALIISFESILLYYNKKRYTVFFIIVIYNLIIDYYSGSRTTFFVLLITIILLIIYAKIPKFYDHIIVKKIITNSYLLLLILTLFMTFLFFYENHISILLDSFLSYRLTNITYYFQSLEINLFGNDLSLYNRTLDTCYAFAVIGLGIIPTILYCYLFNRLFCKLYKIHNYLVIILMLCFTIYGLSERLWLNIDYNFFMICFSFVFFDKEKFLSNVK